MEIRSRATEAPAAVFVLRLRALQALVVIEALTQRLYNLWIAQPQRFRFTLGALSTFHSLLRYTLGPNYVHDDCSCRSVYLDMKMPRIQVNRPYLLALKIFPSSSLTLHSRCSPANQNAKSALRPFQETTSHSLDRVKMAPPTRKPEQQEHDELYEVTNS